MADKVKLTEAQERAFQTVVDGVVRRIYRVNGNVYKGPSHSRFYWQLEALGLLRDGLSSGSIEVVCVVELSTAGRALLSSGKTGAQRALTELQQKEVLTGCTSYVQRKLQIGFNPAARLLDELEDGDYITPPDDNGMRHWGRASSGKDH